MMKSFAAAALAQALSQLASTEQALPLSLMQGRRMASGESIPLLALHKKIGRTNNYGQRQGKREMERRRRQMEKRS